MPEYCDFGNDAPRTFFFKVANRAYALREADVDASVKYNNKMLSNVVLGPDMKPTSMAGAADAEPYLVHLCCFFVDEEDNITNKRVPEATIRGWKPAVMKQLVKWIKDNSDLGVDEESEGNDES